jgi:predicted kinase
MVIADAIDNFSTLDHSRCQDSMPALNDLRDWTTQTAAADRDRFAARRDQGFVRECHGDLHLDNVIVWRGRTTPFDGIEFCDRFRWIDVLSDLAFLAMDFEARGQADFAHALVNRYLEQTADYESLAVLRWYTVYRALVRAKVAAIRADQGDLDAACRRDALADRDHHLRLAGRMIAAPQPRLWITHGLSGSGKTHGSDHWVRTTGAIRIRSDRERKRHFGFAADQRPDDGEQQLLYGEQANRVTYERLWQLAGSLLRDGYAVIVDAAFLRRDERARFARLADSLGIPFTILDFQADEPTLRRRLARRWAEARDASDATAAVLDQQLATQQPLEASEKRYVETISTVTTEPPR